MRNWLTLIPTFQYMIIILLNSDPTNAQYTVKRNPKFDIKKDMSSYHEPDFFDLDTLAGIGLGKRSKTPPTILRFHPAPVTMNENSFRFLENKPSEFQPPIWTPLDHLSQQLPNKMREPRGQMEMASIHGPKFKFSSGS